MKGLRQGLTLLLISLLAACNSTPTPDARKQQAFELAQQSNWRSLEIDTQPFRLQAFVPERLQTDAVLTLYIEGDGLAWLTSSQPSTDPTPANPLALRLALAQPDGNAVYLARPCQFLANQPSCQRRYWTDARFAEEVIAAMGQAVERLKAKTGARELILVGYSGGAAVALLLAARRQDVRQVISVAGNLDHAAWTAHHKVSPLQRSLNPTSQRQILASVPQVHLVGAQDKITPPELARQFILAYPSETPAGLMLFPDYDHACCWARWWPQLWRDGGIPNHGEAVP